MRIKISRTPVLCQVGWHKPGERWSLAEGRMLSVCLRCGELAMSLGTTSAKDAEQSE